MKPYLTALPVEMVSYLEEIVPPIAKLRDSAECAWVACCDCGWGGDMKGNLKWGSIFEERWNKFKEGSAPLTALCKKFYKALEDRGVDPKPYMVELMKVINGIFIKNRCWCKSYNWWVRPRTGGPIDGDYGEEFWRQIVH